MADSIPGTTYENDDQTLEEYLDLLAEMVQSFATSLDLAETLTNTVHRIKEHLHTEAATLFLLDAETHDLVCKECSGPVDITGLRIGLDQGVVGRAVREGRVQMIRDVAQDPDFAGFVDEKTGFSTRSILCAPLAAQGESFGALEVINKCSDDGLFDSRDSSLIRVLASSASLAIHNARMARALLEQERMRKELELAREIQLSLLPAPAAPDFPVHGINAPALEVSGDFFDSFTLDDGVIGFTLGDVSGKGMNAALLMAKTSSLLHCLARDVPRPGQLLARVNKEICESSTRGMFVTVVTGFYDPRTHRACWANAGHQPPLFRRVDGSYEEIPASAPPLGIVAEAEFPEFELDLRGGSLYVFSDGVTEAYGTDDQPLEVEGLQRLLDRLEGLPSQQLLESIVGEIHRKGGKRRDDATVLMIRSARSG
ncbi:MAG: SpoIIE family protein phosphatase [Chromatiales bacterium]|nr:SpoIIE family protein phosphatase [Chromatiales bacterium]